MATGGNVLVLGGYDYKFTSEVPEDLECLVCHLTLKDPVQIVGCGHRLCSICMDSLFRRPSPTCPADRKPLSREKIFPDAACHRQILDLTVKCSHSGCSWTGELRAVEEHESECLFKVVKCLNSGCTEKLTKRDMKTHVALKCSWRKVNCAYCQELLIMHQKQKHLDICRKFPVLCTNKCGVRGIQREKLEVHIWDECPATEVQCEYKNLGCVAVFPRSDVKSHSQTHIERHLNLALRGVEATQHQVHELVTLVKDQSQQIERLVSSNKELSEQITVLKKKLLPTPFKWKVPNFDALSSASRVEKQILVSQPFYLPGYSYRFLLKIEIARPLSQDFLRLFIKIVPGEFDDLLPWPCEEKVRITLVNQDLPLDDRKNISHVIYFKLRKKHSLCDDRHKYRPSLALSIHELHSYITNDTILIRVNREQRD